MSLDLDGWLLVTDLDGTLWDGAMKLHPEAREALGALTAVGVSVLAATARRPASARGAMAANGLLLPAILHDGALGRDFTTGETFHLVSFEPVTARAVLEALQRLGLEPCVNVAHDERDVVLGSSPSTNRRHADFVAPWSRRGDLGLAVATEPVLSFTIVGRDRDLLLPAMDALQTIADASLSDDPIYGGWTLSVRPPGISKWSGALAFCEARSLDPDRTLAVGDGENDVEMLRGAAVSFTFEGPARARRAVPTTSCPRPDPAAGARWPR